MNWKRTAQNLIAAVCAVLFFADIAAAQCGHKRGAASYGSRMTYSSSYSMRTTTYSAATVQYMPAQVVQVQPMYTAPPMAQVQVQYMQSQSPAFRTPVRNFLSNTVGAGRAGGACKT